MVSKQQLWQIVGLDEDRKALTDYMRGLGYEAVLEVEALMMYGEEVTLYGEDADSLATCIEYAKDSWGGEKGDIEAAITYMLSKIDFGRYVEAAIDTL